MHRQRPRGLAAALLTLLLMPLGGCQSHREGLIKMTIEAQQARWHHTDTFAHLLIPRNINPSSDVLHVYIEGDGTPWIKNRYIAKDPSPQNPLALHLMMQDTQNSLYLGRPCYFARYESEDFRTNTSCRPTLWTSARYSASVVESMVAALEAFVETNNYSKVVLIGYSGGGTLAYLMAGKTDKINQIVTIAANLDHGAWTRYHGYSPLQDSLQPTAGSIPPTVSQLHLRGARDRNVPEEVLRKFVAEGKHGADSKTKWVMFPRFDHVCCWKKNWQSILKNLVIDVERPSLERPSLKQRQ